MNKGKPVVQWTLPKWAAELILETLNQDARSAAFDPKLRKQLAAALGAISESRLRKERQVRSGSQTRPQAESE